MSNQWTQKDVEFLKKNAHLGQAALAEALGRSKGSISGKAFQLGIKLGGKAPRPREGAPAGGTPRGPGETKAQSDGTGEVPAGTIRAFGTPETADNGDGSFTHTLTGQDEPGPKEGPAVDLDTARELTVEQPAEREVRCELIEAYCDLIVARIMAASSTIDDDTLKAVENTIARIRDRVAEL